MRGDERSTRMSRAPPGGGEVAISQENDLITFVNSGAASRPAGARRGINLDLALCRGCFHLRSLAEEQKVPRSPEVLAD